MSGKIIRVEVISFFNRNPGRRCTCEEISGMLFKTSEEVKPELDNLVRLGILDCIEDGKRISYAAREAYTSGARHRSREDAGEGRMGEDRRRSEATEAGRFPIEPRHGDTCEKKETEWRCDAGGTPTPRAMQSGLNRYGF